MKGYYLGALHFHGDPEQLLAAYHRLLARFPLETLDVQIAARRDDGITVLDACPTKDVFDEFTTGDTFRDAIEAVGLPVPRVEGIGPIDVAHLREEVAG